jgi:hypothetical protein
VAVIKVSAFANAAAAWIAAVYLVCALGVAVFPGPSRMMAVSWFHGMNINSMWSGRPFPGNFWLGLVSAVVLTWLAAWLFAQLYNYFAKK